VYFCPVGDVYVPGTFVLVTLGKGFGPGGNIGGIGCRGPFGIGDGDGGFPPGNIGGTGDGDGDCASISSPSNLIFLKRISFSS